MVQIKLYLAVLYKLLLKILYTVLSTVYSIISKSVQALIYSFKETLLFIITYTLAVIAIKLIFITGNILFYFDYYIRDRLMVINNNHILLISTRFYIKTDKLFSMIDIYYTYPFKISASAIVDNFGDKCGYICYISNHYGYNIYKIPFQSNSIVHRMRDWIFNKALSIIKRQCICYINNLSITF